MKTKFLKVLRKSLTLNGSKDFRRARISLMDRGNIHAKLISSNYILMSRDSDNHRSNDKQTTEIIFNWPKLMIRNNDISVCAAINKMLLS